MSGAIIRERIMVDDQNKVVTYVKTRTTSLTVQKLDEQVFRLTEYRLPEADALALIKEIFPNAVVLDV